MIGSGDGSAPVPVDGGWVDFFVSYAGPDREWAEWIAWQMEEAGYHTRIQAWDFGAGSHFVQEMHQAALRARRTIAVLSTSYLASAYAAAEWQAAWADDPRGEARKLLVVRVEDCARPGLLNQVVSVDLFGMSRDAARVRLLAALREGRGKPATEPAFPRARAVDTHDPLDLGVHRAIEVAAPDRAASPGRLPLFIARDHDRRLTELIEDPSESFMVVLVGRSSTGKTRSCYEAVRARLGDWPLVHPVDEAELLWLLDAGRIGPSTVLWLNETQLYLQGRDSARVAGALRRLLTTGAGPVVVVGSMWPRYWRALAGQPDLASGQDDRLAQTRALLRLGRVHRIDVPDGFQEISPDVLDAFARKDPRLAIAREAGRADQAITQVLAGGVDLLERYTHTLDDQSRALLTAAMDIRRLGRSGPLPGALLEEAAPGYLAPGQRVAGPDWFAAAVRTATEELRGVRALTPVRSGPGVGEPDGYLLHDYLEQHADTAGRAEPVPAVVWEALAAHADDPDELVRLAVEAEYRGLYQYAHRLAVAAGDDAQALGILADRMSAGGYAGEALVAYEQAARTAGGSHPLEYGAERLETSGHLDEAVACYRRAAEIFGRSEPLRRAAYLLERAGRHDEAFDCRMRALEMAASAPGLRARAEELLADGRTDEALELFHRADQADGSVELSPRGGDLRDPRTLVSDHRWHAQFFDLQHWQDVRDTAELLDTAGRAADADGWLQGLAAAGDRAAVEVASARLVAVGRRGDAISWLRELAERGNLPARREAANQLAAAGQVDEAATCYRQAAEAGDADALWSAASLLLAAALEEAAQRLDGDRDTTHTAADYRARARHLRHDPGGFSLWGIPVSRAPLDDRTIDLRSVDEAVAWFQALGSRGNPDAPRVAARFLQALGRLEEAIGLCQQAADAGDLPTLRTVADLLAAAGHTEAAISRARQVIEAVGREETDDLQPWALGMDWRVLADLLAAAGNEQAAIEAYQRAAEAGDSEGQEAAVGLLLHAGRTDELATWAEDRIWPGDSRVAQNVAQTLAATGHRAQAAGLYLRLGKAGDKAALRTAAALLAKLGHPDDAIGCYRLLADDGDIDATREAAAILTAENRQEEAAAWLVRLLTRLGARGGHGAAEEVHAQLADLGMSEVAATSLFREADSGDPGALGAAARLLAATGRTAESIQYCERLVAAGPTPNAISATADLLEETIGTDRTIGWLRGLAARGERGALLEAADRLEDAGHINDALACLQEAAEAGDLDVPRYLAQRLTRSGRDIGELAVLRRLIGSDIAGWLLRRMASDTDFTPERAAALLEMAGHHVDAGRLRQFGVTPEGRIADPWWVPDQAPRAGLEGPT